MCDTSVGRLQESAQSVEFPVCLHTHTLTHIPSVFNTFTIATSDEPCGRNALTVQLRKYVCHKTQDTP